MSLLSKFSVVLLSLETSWLSFLKISLKPIFSYMKKIDRIILSPTQINQHLRILSLIKPAILVKYKNPSSFLFFIILAN